MYRPYRCILLGILALPALADWAARYQAGEALLADGRATAALEEFKLALRQAESASVSGPQRCAIHDALGRAAFRAANHRDAKRHFERALALVGDQHQLRAPVLSNLGQAYQELGELVRAEDVYREALQAVPGRAGLWRQLGGVLFLRHRYAEAELAYRKSIDLADPPTAALTRNDLAVLFESRGNLRQALALLQEAISNAPAGQPHARILGNLGVLQLKLGDAEAAASALRRSLDEMELALGPDHPDVAEILLAYGQVLRKTGQKVEATQAAKRAEAILSAFATKTNYSGLTVDYRDLKK